jgi:hypothetical protein
MCHPLLLLLLLLRCTRKSSLVEYDDDSFIDRWKDEITDAEEEINDSITYRDGVWLFDMGWDPAEECNFSEKHPADKPIARLSRSAGTVRAYSSLAAANAAAALVWQSLQVNHRLDKVFLGVISSSSEDESEDENEEYEEEEDQPDHEDPGYDPRYDPEFHPAGHTAAQPEGRQQQQQQQASPHGMNCSNDSSSSNEFCTVRSDGRCSWSRTRQYYVDPWHSEGSDSESLHNVVSSTCTVEVVKAQLE